MNGIGTWNLVSYLIDKLDVGGTPAAMAITFGGVLLCMIIPYLLGSLNFGVMISQRHYRDDVRTHGSGNAGATNMLRTFGWKAAVLTMAERKRPIMPGTMPHEKKWMPMVVATIPVAIYALRRTVRRFFISSSTR